MKKLGYLVLAMFSSLMLAACAQQKSEEKEKEDTENFFHG